MDAHQQVVEEIEEGEIIEEEEEGEIVKEKEEDCAAADLREHVCDVCRKSFSSGKALGGHMRCHSNQGIDQSQYEDEDDYEPTQNSRKRKFPKSKKMKQVMESSDCYPTGDFDAPTCGVCGKEFPSQNSLYGHMRCHPDRKGKGVYKSHSPYLPAKTLGNCKYGESPDLLKLMLLADVACEESLTLSLQMSRGGLSEIPETYLGLKNRNLPEYDDSVVMARKKKKIKFNNVENVYGEVMEYKCSNCGKLFPSHQALGGHRSKNCNSRNLASGREADLGFNALPPLSILSYSYKEEVINTDVSPSEKVDIGSSGSRQQSHRCQTCRKTFSTGQALGGHMRAHWLGPLPGENEDQVTSGTETTGTTSTVTFKEEEPGDTNKVVFDFDLNELPVTEGDEGDYSGFESRQPGDMNAASSHGSATY